MQYNRILFLSILLLTNIEAFTQPSSVTKFENVTYGVVSGTALLMDIYQPQSSNNRGIIYIAGSGFGSPSIWNDVPLKEMFHDTGYAGISPRGLLSKGYTVFMINHSFTPRFAFPDIFYDCQRAVRFARSNAKKYNIDSNYIGAMGHSSGGYLAAMLGVKDSIIANPKNETDRVSSKVQSVVTLAAPFDLSDYGKKGDTAIQTIRMIKVYADYFGELPQTNKAEFILSGKYAEGSPITFVSNDDAPFLIYYSDNDHLIPPRQALAYYEKLTGNNVAAKIILCKNCKHDPVPDMNEVDSWFKKYLKIAR